MGEEDEEEGEERKKSRFQFRWETVRLSWKRLVETFYENNNNNNNNNNEKNENNKENEGERVPGKLFVAVPGRVWMINNEDGSDSESSSSSSSSSDEDEDEDAEDTEEKALRKTREDCAKFSKEVINRIVFGVAWKKGHESISRGRGDGGDGNKNSTISWSKYNRDPLETMNTDEYEEDVYERDLHAKARFDRRWPLVNRVNWLHSFRKIVSKFRDEEESRAFDEEEENTDDEEDEEEGEERKKSRFQFRWETVRLSWKRLVETFYENNNNGHRRESLGYPRPTIM